MKIISLLLFLLFLDFEAWPFEIILSTNLLTQGDTLAIEVTEVREGSRYSCWFNADKHPLYPTKKGSLRALIGLSYDFVPGRYAVLIVEKEKGKKPKKKYKLLAVQRKYFPTSYVNFTQEKRELMASPLNERERKLISTELKVDNEEQSWDGKFILPVEGKTVGKYGVKRMAGSKFLWNHKGVDLKATEGTPIKAANGGEVMLTEEGFYIHGKTVMINHGQGVITIYLHLNSISVQKGDRVTKGDVIGEVGETGLTTSSHLHWGLYVHGVPVDPFPWVEREY